MVELNFAQLRQNMVDNQLQTAGVIDHELLRSMGEVPRELFVPEQYQSIAYLDKDIKLTDERYLMAPVSLGRLIQYAQVKPSDIVLIVGCNIGYSVAIVANLANMVVGVEQDRDLAKQASKILEELDVGNGAVLSGNPAKGLPSEAPFDVIIIEGSIDEVPQALFKQLREGGRLIAPIDNGATDIVCLYKKSDGDIGASKIYDAKLPKLKLRQKQPEFVF